jgi:hypothetical protein
VRDVVRSIRSIRLVRVWVSSSSGSRYFGRSDRAYRSTLVLYSVLSMFGWAIPLKLCLLLFGVLDHEVVWPCTCVSAARDARTLQHHDISMGARISQLLPSQNGRTVTGGVYQRPAYHHPPVWHHLSALAAGDRVLGMYDDGGEGRGEDTTQS